MSTSPSPRRPSKPQTSPNPHRLSPSTVPAASQPSQPPTSIPPAALPVVEPAPSRASHTFAPLAPAKPPAHNASNAQSFETSPPQSPTKKRKGMESSPAPNPTPPTATAATALKPSTDAATAPAVASATSSAAAVASSTAPTDATPERPAKKSRTNTPWTPAEEKRLKAMRDESKTWSEIAKTFPNRTEGSVKKHWYKDMHYADFAEDESQALLQAIKEYDANKWKVIGQKVGKPAKACEQYAKENFTGRI